MCLPMIVTVLSGAIRTKAFGAKASAASARWSSRRTPTRSAAPASAVDWMNRRRVSMVSTSERPGRLVDGGADADVRGTAADVAGHGRVDVAVGRAADLGQQRDRRHDLAGLAVTALGDVEPAPRALDRLRHRPKDALDGDDVPAGERRRRRDARADGAAVDVNGARSALSDAAAVLRPGQAELVTEHPQERNVAVGVDGPARAVDLQRGHRSPPSGR